LPEPRPAAPVFTPPPPRAAPAPETPPPPPTGPANAQPATDAPAPPSEPPPGPSQPAAAPDRQPATVDELRSLRRWLIVAAIWAVAATAISVLAFVTANDDDAQRAEDTSEETQAVQRRVNRQLAQLRARLAGLPQAATVEGIEQRLRSLERVKARQDKALVSIDAQLKAIRQRIDSVEQTAQDAAADSTNTTTTP
jgi:hypothetical protein